MQVLNCTVRILKAKIFRPSWQSIFFTSCSSRCWCSSAHSQWCCNTNFTLKGQCHKIFDPNIFASNTLSGPLMNRIIQFYTFLFPFEDVCLQSLKFMCPHWQCGHGIFCLIFTLKSLRNLQNLPPMSSMSLFYLRSYITTMVTQCQKSQQTWWLSFRIVNNHGDSVWE